MNSNIYQRPVNKPRFTVVNNRKVAPKMALPEEVEIIEVDKYTECHVTPLDVANRMVSYLSATLDDEILEPEAGTGNIIKALIDEGYSTKKITAIERHYNLCNTIEKRFTGEQFIEPIQQCFLEFASQTHKRFAKIIMNPPFKNVKAHIKSAFSLLSHGGSIIALVPVSYEHPNAELLEELPSDTFPTAKVFTKIIEITK